MDDAQRNDLAAKISPQATRPEFTKYEKIWRLYLDLIELDKEKLECLVEEHPGEDATQLKTRKALASVFNLIPAVLDIIKLYLFAEEPTFNVNDDADLKAFIENCDGAGTRWSDYVRQTALPMSLGMGWLDVLVQNPLLPDAPTTEAEAQVNGATPVIFSITPLQRNNWSCKPNDEYNWLTFADKSDESKLPFDPLTKLQTYVTLIAAGATDDMPRSIWVRHTPGEASGSWETESGECPTARVPVASIFYKKSNDPKQRHFGLSKIAMMAVLTKKIVQVLSWTDEDILANLAILALPTKDGKSPKNADGTDSVKNIGVFSLIYYDQTSSNAPSVVQGNVSHIAMKLTLCGEYLTEILRLAHLTSVSGSAGTKASQSAGDTGKESSGFHAVVNRNELFHELTERAYALDTFTLDVFALVKSWATNEDWSRKKIQNANISANFYKGPYLGEALQDVLKNASAAIQLFRDISPTLCKNQLSQTARAVLYQGDPDIQKVLSEITDNSDAAMAQSTAGALINEAAAIIDGAVTAQTQSNESAAADTAP